MISPPRCGSCNFWRPQIPPGLSLGRCHRKPPSARSGWPSTSPQEWCGEWETNPNGEYGYENRWEPAQQADDAGELIPDGAGELAPDDAGESVQTEFRVSLPKQTWRMFHRGKLVSESTLEDMEEPARRLELQAFLEGKSKVCP